jgi:hypothetical protein
MTRNITKAIPFLAYLAWDRVGCLIQIALARRALKKAKFWKPFTIREIEIAIEFVDAELPQILEKSMIQAHIALPKKKKQKKLV